MHIEHSDFNDQLVRGLTHKMNNILSLFHGYLGLLLDDKKLDQDVLEGLARIKEGAHAASELMDRTKALARPSSVVWRQLNPGDFLHMLKPSFEAMCERGVTLEIVCHEDLPPLWSDTGRLRTAITEIVRNACEASPRNGVVRVEVGAESQPQPHKGGVPPIQWICISVSNNGEPITPEIAAKIFQPFFTTKLKLNATGLGLTVALGLIQQLGGVIRFVSEPDGTKFRLLLPSRVEGF